MAFKTSWYWLGGEIIFWQPGDQVWWFSHPAWKTMSVLGTDSNGNLQTTAESTVWIQASAIPRGRVVPSLELAPSDPPFVLTDKVQVVEQWVETRGITSPSSFPPYTSYESNFTLLVRFRVPQGSDTPVIIRPYFQVGYFDLSN